MESKLPVARERRRGNRHARIRDFALRPRRRLPTMRLTGRGAACPSGSKLPRIQEDVVKELSLEEVLRIAGGVPLTSALDELTYRAPEEPAADPVDYAHLLVTGPRAPEPT
jgi:hypothetical protein